MISAALAPIAAAFTVTAAGLFAARNSVQNMPHQAGESTLWQSLTSNSSRDPQMTALHASHSKA